MNKSTKEEINQHSLIPKVTSIERLNLTLAPAGKAVLVWDTTLSKVCVHNGTAWYILTTTAE